MISSEALVEMEGMAIRFLWDKVSEQEWTSLSHWIRKRLQQHGGMTPEDLQPQVSRQFRHLQITTVERMVASFIYFDHRERFALSACGHLYMVSKAIRQTLNNVQ